MLYGKQNDIPFPYIFEFEYRYFKILLGLLWPNKISNISVNPSNVSHRNKPMTCIFSSYYINHNITIMIIIIKMLTLILLIILIIIISNII